MQVIQNIHKITLFQTLDLIMILSQLIRMIKPLKVTVDQMELDVDNLGMLLMLKKISIPFQPALQLNAKLRPWKLKNQLKIEGLLIKKILRIQVRKLRLVQFHFVHHLNARPPAVLQLNLTIQYTVLFKCHVIQSQHAHLLDARLTPLPKNQKHQRD